MRYVYTVADKKGEKKHGVIEADDRKKAIAELKRSGKTIIFLSAETKKIILYLPYVSSFEKMAMTKHLAIMLKAGLTLDATMKTLILQFTGKLRSVLDDVYDSIEAGSGLAEAMAQHPRVFNDYFVNMVKAGESSGNLPENLERLADRLSKDHELKQKVVSAMFYPTMVFALTLALALSISLFVLPRLTGLFKAFDFELPLTTKIMLVFSNFMANHGVLAAMIVIIGIPTFIFVLRLKPVRPFSHALYLKLPLINKLIMDINLARFSIILSSLLESGLPIDKAVKICRDVIGNYRYKAAIQRLNEGIVTGKPASDVLSEFQSIFPPFVVQMIASGEESGKLEDMLSYLGEFYEKELDNKLKNLSTIVEPGLLIIIGLMVAFTAIAIITPVYNFIGEI